MRVPLLIVVVLLLGACGKNGPADQTQNADENLTADSIVSNDVTAIDAVTGDAANMAADVDMNFGNLDEGTDTSSNGSSPSKPTSSRPATTKSAPASSAAPPEANTVSNTATNSE